MLARLKIIFEEVEDEGEENYIDTVDNQLREKFYKTPMEVPEDIVIGHTINLNDYVGNLDDLTQDEAENFQGWAVISTVTNITSEEDGMTVVEVELCEEEPW